MAFKIACAMYSGRQGISSTQHTPDEPFSEPFPKGKYPVTVCELLFPPGQVVTFQCFHGKCRLPQTDHYKPVVKTPKFSEGPHIHKNGKLGP